MSAIRLTLAAATWTDVSTTVALVGDEFTMITPLSDVSVALSVAEPSSGEDLTPNEAYGVSLNSDAADDLKVWVLSTAGGNIRFYNNGNSKTLKPLVPVGAEANVDPDPPTRSEHAISGARTNIAIPDDVTWFRYSTGILVPSGTTEAPYAGVTWGSGPTDQDFSGVEMLYSDAFGVAVVTANPAVNVCANDGGGLQRSMAGMVWAPRDASKKTMAEGHGVAWGLPKARRRDVVADLAKDDDVFFISGNAGTVTGTVTIEWFYT